jgi:hypothetical protein
LKEREKRNREINKSIKYVFITMPYQETRSRWIKNLNSQYDLIHFTYFQVGYDLNIRQIFKLEYNIHENRLDDLFECLRIE